MLEGVFQVLNLLYQKCQEPAPEDKIDQNIRPEEIYMVANPEIKSWEILKPKEIADRYRNQI